MDELKMAYFKFNNITNSLLQQGKKRQSIVVFPLAACSIICIVLKLIAMGTNTWIIFAGSKGDVGNGTNLEKETVQFGLFKGVKTIDIDSINFNCLLNVVCDYVNSRCFLVYDQTIKQKKTGINLLEFNCTPSSINMKNHLETSLLGSLEQLNTIFTNISKLTGLADIFIPLNLWLTTVISLSLTIFSQFVSLRLYFLNWPSNDTARFLIYLSNGATSVIDFIILSLWGCFCSSNNGGKFSEGWSTKSTSLGYSYWLVLVSLIVTAASTVLFLWNNNLKLRNQPKFEAAHLANFINANIIGRDYVFVGPYGPRVATYCDYTASGKALKCIEDYISNNVLPSYGNTHTTTSQCSMKTTLLREEARKIIRQAVGASEEDAVIFVGSGSTGAIHKLIGSLGITHSQNLTVIVGAREHHSNLIPWRELGGNIVRIQEKPDGQLDLTQLENALRAASSQLIIGAFSAASNITGILSPDVTVTALLHRYGALSFWDYATAAPYVNISMNPKTSHGALAYKDAIYFSTHKFVGGVETPGVLVVKKSLMKTLRVPNCAGGGTVVFVDRIHHMYVDDVETREEGGTPAIVGSIRAGLVFKLKESLTEKWIMEREDHLVRLALKTWCTIPEFVLLGNPNVPRLGIFSFLIRHPVLQNYFLHHNFVCTLLNDLYGIQARAGCACAGPYAQDLLNIDNNLARQYENLLADPEASYVIFKPGFSRLNLPYVASDEEIDFILRAVSAVAVNGWKLLPYYRMNIKTGDWHHHTKNDTSVALVDHTNVGKMFFNPEVDDVSTTRIPSFTMRLREGNTILDQAENHLNRMTNDLDSCISTIFSDNPSLKLLRWFLLPSEAKTLMLTNLSMESAMPCVKSPIFTPLSYGPVVLTNNSTYFEDSCSMFPPAMRNGK